MTVYLLSFVIAQCFYCDSAKQENREDIYDCHNSHSDICNIPHEGKVGLCAKKNGNDTGDAEKIQEHFVVFDKQNIRFCIVIISDKAAECEGEN